MEKKVFFLVKLKTKTKARWIEHIIKTQFGVNLAIVNFEQRIILIEYNSEFVTLQYMRMLVRSLGCDLVFDDNEIENRRNQLGNLIILNKRRKIIFFVFFLSIIGLICSFSSLFQFFFSISTFVLYYSLFINVLNGHYRRFMWHVDRVCFLFSLLLEGFGVFDMIISNNKFSVSVYFIATIFVVQLLLLYRWFKEKRIAEIELL